MSVDRSVFQALESAVAGMPPTDPSAVPVRIHLAGLYLSAGQAESERRTLRDRINGS